jgi:hypothetical protein
MLDAFSRDAVLIMEKPAGLPACGLFYDRSVS